MEPHMIESVSNLPDYFRGPARSNYMRINHAGFIIKYNNKIYRLFGSFILAASG